MKFRNFLLYWLPLILYAGLIFYLSSLSQPIPSDFLEQISFKDKIFHVIEYFFLSFLIFRLLIKYKIKNAWLYAAIFAGMYGITDEIHQFFVSGRFFSYFDILANFVGSLSVFILRKFRRL